MQFNDKTLAEINEHDKENLKHLLGDGMVREFYFPTIKQCSDFVGKCFNAAMIKLGVAIKPGMHPKMVDRLLKTHGVKVERRKYKDDFEKCELCGGTGKKGEKVCPDCVGTKQVAKNELWRSGLYIYKANEIAAFVSIPITWKKTGIIIRPGLPTFNRGYKVLTTVVP